MWLAFEDSQGQNQELSVGAERSAIVERVFEIVNYSEDEAAVMSFDLSKAYNNVDHNFLIEKKDQYGVPNGLDQEVEERPVCRWHSNGLSNQKLSISPCNS